MFSHCHHGDLQTMWLQAHYSDAERMRGRPLTAVDRLVFVGESVCVVIRESV